MQIFIAVIGITMLVISFWTLVFMSINNDSELDHYLDED